MTVTELYEAFNFFDKTYFFDIHTGVRQGYVLSPLLFSLFINNLAKKLDQSGIGIQVKNKKISSLFYADDIVIVTESKEKLQKGLDIVAEWGRKWRCKYSSTKTQVVIFGRKKQHKNIDWKIGHTAIEQVESYKYLGLEMQQKLIWKLFKERLIRKANKSMSAAWGMGQRG